MNYLTFHYFLAVAESGSIKQAAASLMIAPQSLSEQMRKLEQELGVELFTHSRPVRLTACGQRFQRYAASMLQQRYQMERDLREMTDRHREIVISVSPTDFPPFLAPVLTEFAAAYPDCLVSIVERSGSTFTLQTCDLNISEQSLGKDLEEVLIQSPGEPRESSSELSSNRFAVVAHVNLLRRVWGDQYAQRLSSAMETPSISAFRDVPSIRFYNPTLDGSIDQLFEGAGFLPQIVAKSVDSGICVELCAAGMGYIIVPDGWALRRLGPKINDRELRLFPLSSYYPNPGTIVSYPAGKALNEEEQALIELIRKHVGGP